VEAEAELIVDAARRVLEGETLSSIVDNWNRRGICTTTGGPWRINALSALLIQPRLAGMEQTPADFGTRPVPPIFDRATHEQLLALRHSRRRSPGGRRDADVGRQYLLSGFLRCWRCGSRLGGITPGASTVRPHYRCPSRGAGGCSGVVVHASHAEQAAGDIVLTRICAPEFARSVDSRETALAQEERAMTSLVADALMGRRPDGGSAGLWTDAARIDAGAWEKLKETLEATARSGPTELASQTLLARQRRLCEVGQDLRPRWPGMDLEEQRAVIDSVVDHFVVQAAPRVRNRFTSQRLTPVWRS